MAVCPSFTMVGDDRWGEYGVPCELPAGHSGRHVSELSATRPLARMSWVDIDRQQKLAAIVSQLRDVGAPRTAALVAGELQNGVPSCGNPPIHKTSA